MAATTGPLTAVLTADCNRAMRRLPFGSRAVAFLSRSAGSAVMDAGRIARVELPELLLTKTSDDFFRASALLWAGATGGAGAGTVATTGGACGTVEAPCAWRYASRAGSMGGMLASVFPGFGCVRTRNRPVAFTSSALS